MTLNSTKLLWVKSYKQFLNYNFDGPTLLVGVFQIKIPDNSKKWIMSGVISIQVFIILAAYNAIATGLTGFAEFLIGVCLLIFVALYLVYKADEKPKKETKSLS